MPDPLFESYPLNEAGQKKTVLITEAFNGLLTELRPVCPEGREWSIVKTKLEEAAFYARKAMALAPINQGRGIGAGG